MLEKEYSAHCTVIREMYYARPQIVPVCVQNECVFKSNRFCHYTDFYLFFFSIPVKHAATTAMLNSLEFTKANFDKEVKFIEKHLIVKCQSRKVICRVFSTN